MRNIATRKTGSTLGLVMILCCTLFCCSEEPPTLRVGFESDVSTRHALNAALETIEQSGSPVRVEIVTDNSNPRSPANSVQSAHEFSQDPDIDAVIGYAGSDSALAAARILNRHGIPQIVSAATSPKLIDTGRWTFKLLPNDTYQARFLAETARDHFQAQRCAVIYQNGDYGRGLAALFTEAFQRLGGEITATVLTGSGNQEEDTQDLYIQKIVDSKPDLLVLICQAYQAKVVESKLAHQGFSLPLLASESLDTWALVKDRPGLLKNTKVALFYHPDLPTRGNREFVAAYRERAAFSPAYRSALIYDALLLLHQAALDGAPTREGIRAYLAGLGDTRPAYQGVTGAIAFDENREAFRPLRLGIIEGGAMKLVHPEKAGVEEKEAR